MTWLKLDDQVTEHPKCVGLSCEAWTLWLHGLTYCSRNLTDGVIPDAILTRLSPCRRPRKAAQELVDAGLWDRIENAHSVHDYAQHQRTRNEIDNLKKASMERQKRSRERRQASNGGDSSEPVTHVSQRDNGVSHSPVTAPDTDTDTDTDSDNTLQRGTRGVDPDVAKQAAAVMARVRAEAGRTRGKHDAADTIAAADGRVVDLLEGHPGAPTSTVVACLLGEPHNLHLYRRHDDDPAARRRGQADG